MNVLKKIFIISNNIRTVIINTFFWIIVGIIIFTLFFSKEETSIGRTLVIKPTGDIYDSPTEVELADLIGANKLTENTMLKEILFAIETAIKDKNIDRVVLDLQYMGSLGFGNMKEIGSSLERLKNARKEILAFSSFYNQEAYYIASFADEIVMDPYGDVYFNGIGVYRNYYKDLLDKYKVDVNVFRAGGYKSFVEPYIENSMSSDVKTQNLLWMTSIWDNITNTIAENRSLNNEVLLDLIDSKVSHLEKYKGNSSQMALKTGLVDTLKAGNIFTDELGECYNFKDYNRNNSSLVLGKKTGVLNIEGAITYSDNKPGSVSSVEVISLLDSVLDDNDFEALIVRINSGGGGVFASEVIRRKIEEVNEKIPVVISMGDVCASGGYWIATSGDYIFANPTTITGSIGVFGIQFGLEDTLRDNWGVNNDGVGTTYNSGDGGLTRNLSKKSAKEYQLTVNNTYNNFLDLITKSRDISKEELINIAGGRVWTGEQAAQFKLIDEDGGFLDAVSYLNKEYGIKGDLEYLEADMGIIDSILSLFSQNISIPDSVLFKFSKEISNDLKTFEKIDDPKGLYSIWY